MGPVPSSDLSWATFFYSYVLVFQVRIHLLAQHDGDAVSVTHSLSAWYYPSWFTRHDHSEIRHKRSKRELLILITFTKWLQIPFLIRSQIHMVKKGFYSVISTVKSTMVKSDRYFDNLREPKLTDFEWIKKLNQQNLGITF